MIGVCGDSLSYQGISGYTTGVSGVDLVVGLMKQKNLNIWRASFTPSWKTPSYGHQYEKSRVDRYLGTHHGIIIVDRNHLYPPGATSDNDAVAHWADVENAVFDVFKTWPNNPRVWVEMINEYTRGDLYQRFQTLITKIRSAGYFNPMVCNKMQQSWAKMSDPLNEAYEGYHFYFNAWSASSAITYLKNGLSQGTKMVCTEVGASFNEHSDFSATNVAHLQSYLNQCVTLGVNNTVWMREDIENWPTYESFSLVIPTGSRERK